jgi:Ca2+-binding EF-hand superfamily protein
MMTKQAMVALFNQFDDNKDGKISLAEYVAHEGFRVYGDRPVDQEFLTKRFFDNMDPQKKGFVTQDKFLPISLQKCGG